MIFEFRPWLFWLGAKLFFGGGAVAPWGLWDTDFLESGGKKKEEGARSRPGKRRTPCSGVGAWRLDFFCVWGGMLEGYLGVVNGHYGVGGWGGFYLLAEVGEAGEVGTEEPAADGGFGVETELLEDGHG